MAGMDGREEENESMGILPGGVKCFSSEERIMNGEQILSAVSIFSMTLILCTLTFSLAVYKSSENIDIDVIYKINDFELKRK